MQGASGPVFVLVTQIQCIFEVTKTAILLLARGRIFGTVLFTVWEERSLQILHHIHFQHIEIALWQVAFPGSCHAPA